MPSMNPYQNLIAQMKDVIGRKVGLLDDVLNVISASDEGIINSIFEPADNIVGNGPGIYAHNGYTFNVIGNRGKIDSVVFVEGEDEMARTYASIIGVSASGIKQIYDAKYDKSSFIKNVILDNVLRGDIHLRVKELKIDPDAHRVAMLIRVVDGDDVQIFELVHNMFPDNDKDFLVSINETDIVLVKEVEADFNPRELEKLAKEIVDTIGVEAYVKINVGIGTVAENIKVLARTFKEAQVALEVGKVFDTEKSIVSYDNLGIGRLIYHLPTRLCEMFLNEIFKKESIEVLDQETIITIQKFFENNLNVSETSRKLYVHRNTLVYRLDKIHKLTGLDLRMFDDAIVFKVAMMVKKYLVSNPIKI